MSEGLVKRARDLLLGYLKSSPRVLKAARAATARWLRMRPIETRPAWLGRLHEVAVPRMVVRNATPSPAGSANINVIFDQLERTRSVDGDIAECGVFRGRTLASIALWVRQHSVRKHIL